MMRIGRVGSGPREPFSWWTSLPSTNQLIVPWFHHSMA
ncbi:hypothetical protein SBADM41S_01721 [Streptomyces badius]